MQIRKSDDVVGGSTKTALKQSIDNNSWNIKAVFFKLGTSNVHHKRNIMTLSVMDIVCNGGLYSYAAGSVLIMTKILRFYP